MSRLGMIGGAAAAVVGTTALAWAMGWGPFASSLSAQERALVDTIERGEYRDNPAAAAQFVTDNLDLLLSAEVADAVDDDAVADLFAAALQDRSTQADLLSSAVAAVAEEGTIHDDALPPVLADVVAQNMGWFDERINAPAYNSSADTRGAALDTHDFLRELFRDPSAAEMLTQAVYDYGLAQVTAAPDAGPGRVERLKDLGGLQIVFLEARDNAEQGQAIHDHDDDALEAAEDADAARGGDARVDRAAWLAVDLYNSDPAVRDLARGQPFVDADGNLKTDMAPEEEQAFREWAVRAVVGHDRAPGPAYDDEDMIGAGADDVGIDVEDRF